MDLGEELDSQQGDNCIFVGMLGTGWNVKRAQEHGNLFIRTLGYLSPKVHARVFDGPVASAKNPLGSALGAPLDDSIDQAAAYIKQHWKASPVVNKLAVAGFSRGSMGAVKLLNALSREGIDADSLIVFDPVPGIGRAAWEQARVVPKGTKQVHCFLQRDENKFFLKPWIPIPSGLSTRMSYKTLPGRHGAAQTESMRVEDGEDVAAARYADGFMRKELQRLGMTDGQVISETEFNELREGIGEEVLETYTQERKSLKNPIASSRHEVAAIERASEPLGGLKYRETNLRILPSQLRILQDQLLYYSKASDLDNAARQTMLAVLDTVNELVTRIHDHATNEGSGVNSRLVNRFYNRLFEVINGKDMSKDDLQSMIVGIIGLIDEQDKETRRNSLGVLTDLVTPAPLIMQRDFYRSSFVGNILSPIRMSLRKLLRDAGWEHMKRPESPVHLKLTVPKLLDSSASLTADMMFKMVSVCELLKSMIDDIKDRHSGNKLVQSAISQCEEALSMGAVLDVASQSRVANLHGFSVLLDDLYDQALREDSEPELKNALDSLRVWRDMLLSYPDEMLIKLIKAREIDIKESPFFSSNNQIKAVNKYADGLVQMKLTSYQLTQQDIDSRPLLGAHRSSIKVESPKSKPSPSAEEITMLDPGDSLQQLTTTNPLSSDLSSDQKESSEPRGEGDPPVGLGRRGGFGR